MAIDKYINKLQATYSRAKGIITDNLQYHLVNSTALVAASTPIFAISENIISGMSDWNSLKARLVAAALTYSGLGFFIAKTRDLSRKRFKITENSKEIIQNLHDAIHLAVFNLGFAPAFYFCIGIRNLEEIIYGTAGAMGISLLSGGVMGYSMDLYRDLTGIQPSKRIPSTLTT